MAHVAAFRRIQVIDIRAAPESIPNVEFIQLNLMSIDDSYTEYCDSISSLHAIEHFGLGRYGDPIDSEGHIRGLDNIYKMLKPNGKFYFSVPIGPLRVEFNAHRVFSIGYLLDLFSRLYRIDSFSFVGDDGKLYENVALTSDIVDTNCGCKYGCGIFEMTKL